jgi:hypothetical protein
LHERHVLPPEDALPNRDIQLSEDFLRDKEELVVYISEALARAIEKEKAVDQDAQEALAALIRTYRTLDSGLVYETRPANPYAAALQDALKNAIEKLSREIAETSGLPPLRSADILGVLVFLERIGLQYANGRRRGRAFYDFLNAHFPAAAAGSADAPMVAL